jgi:hypothetical protein
VAVGKKAIRHISYDPRVAFSSSGQPLPAMQSQQKGTPSALLRCTISGGAFPYVRNADLGGDNAAHSVQAAPSKSAPFQAFPMAPMGSTVRNFDLARALAWSAALTSRPFVMEIVISLIVGFAAGYGVREDFPPTPQDGETTSARAWMRGWGPFRSPSVQQ